MKGVAKSIAKVVDEELQSFLAVNLPQRSRSQSEEKPKEVNTTFGAVCITKAFAIQNNEGKLSTAFRSLGFGGQKMKFKAIKEKAA